MQGVFVCEKTLSDMLYLGLGGFIAAVLRRYHSPKACSPQCHHFVLQTYRQYEQWGIVFMTAPEYVPMRMNAVNSVHNAACLFALPQNSLIS